MTEVRAAGIRVDVPPGWEADIRARTAQVPLSKDRPGGPPTFMHVANFQLPPDRAEYGGEILAGLGLADVFISVIDFGPVTSEQRLFDHVGMPRPLRSEDFDPSAIVRGLRGKSAVQRFFQANGHGYCLYVVVGSHMDRSDLLPGVNDVLASIRFEA